MQKKHLVYIQDGMNEKFCEHFSQNLETSLKRKKIIKLNLFNNKKNFKFVILKVYILYVCKLNTGL